MLALGAGDGSLCRPGVAGHARCADVRRHLVQERDGRERVELRGRRRGCLCECRRRDHDRGDERAEHGDPPHGCRRGMSTAPPSRPGPERDDLTRRQRPDRRSSRTCRPAPAHGCAPTCRAAPACGRRRVGRAASRGRRRSSRAARTGRPRPTGVVGHGRLDPGAVQDLLGARVQVGQQVAVGARVRPRRRGGS